jgi:hypothetical protein
VAIPATSVKPQKHHERTHRRHHRRGCHGVHPDDGFVGTTEYRLTTLGPDEPPLGWEVWVSDQGDLVVSKRDGLGFVRPQLTRNEGYLMVSILRAEDRAEDRYLRRRLHRLVAMAFHGRAPSSDALVEHLDDDPENCGAANLRWATPAENRARKTANDRADVPKGKIRKLPINMRVVRELQQRTGMKGKALATFVEALIATAIKEMSGGA